MKNNLAIRDPTFGTSPFSFPSEEFQKLTDSELLQIYDEIQIAEHEGYVSTATLFSTVVTKLEKVYDFSTGADANRRVISALFREMARRWYLRAKEVM